MRKGPRMLTHAHSDSEANPSGHFYSHANQLPSVPEDSTFRYGRLNSLDGNQTDDMDDDERNADASRGRSYSLDEFGDNLDSASRLVRTGRQRKKLAARSKGGEFRTKRKKRRVYFCCASSEIDVQKLFDYLIGAGSLLNGWKYQLHADVLHLYKPGYEERNLPTSSIPTLQEWTSTSDGNAVPGNGNLADSLIADDRPDVQGVGMHRGEAQHNVRFAENLVGLNTLPNEPQWSDNSRISGIGAQEVFVFDFGAAVFWVLNLLLSNWCP